MNSNFADNLKKIRKEYGLSQEQLADKLGVSRQSVSKWESQQAYPEMDKVIQMCNMFNLNIDELLNKDIKEVKEEKESKNIINKYLDDFLNFVTKTINMFASMTASQKIKCIVEQLVIMFILMIMCHIIGSIGYTLIEGFRGVMPHRMFYFITGILEFVYLTIYVGLSVIAMIHVFKARYLDYYVEPKKEVKEVMAESKKEEAKEEYNEPENKKVIIRDPKDSEYGFLKGILKCILFFIKLNLACVAVGFSFALVGLVAALFLAIYHIFINPIFIGIVIGLIGAIIVDIILLVGLYEFIFNKKFHAKQLFLSLLVSLVLIGVAISVVFMGSLKFKVVNRSYDFDSVETQVYPYTEDLTIKSYDTNNYKFVVDNNMTNDVKIEVNYNETSDKIEINKSANIISIHEDNLLEENLLYFYKNAVEAIKKNEIPNHIYVDFETVVTTSESNIKNIIRNMTANKDSEVSVDNGVYYLTIYRTTNSAICYQKDGYYSSCVNVYGNYNDSEISYDGNNIIYDSNTYDCYKKYGDYYCDRK